MSDELSSVLHDIHRRLVREALEEARTDPEVIGLMLMGSVARGDALPGSDLDLFLLLQDGCRRDFRTEVRLGILIEQKFADSAQARERLERKPMELYSYLDSRILYDPESRFHDLTKIARRLFRSYRTPREEKEYLSHCLRSAKIKLEAALAAGGEFKAAYVTSMTTWFVLEALWAVNDRPVPPGGALLAHMRRLTRKPDNADTWVRAFFAGDAQERVQATREIIGWLLTHLSE